MNAGQIEMLFPFGTTSSTVVPAASPAAATPGETQATPFAGILNIVASRSPLGLPGTVAAVIPIAPEADAAVVQEPHLTVPVAPAAVGSGDASIPAMGKKAAPEEERPAPLSATRSDLLMPQNVALGLVGVPSAPAIPVDGRMPQDEEKVTFGETSHSSRVASAEMAQPPKTATPVPQVETLPGKVSVAPSTAIDPATPVKAAVTKTAEQQVGSSSPEQDIITRATLANLQAQPAVSMFEPLTARVAASAARPVEPTITASTGSVNAVAAVRPTAEQVGHIERQVTKPPVELTDSAAVSAGIDTPPAATAAEPAQPLSASGGLFVSNPDVALPVASEEPVAIRSHVALSSQASLPPTSAAVTEPQVITPVSANPAIPQQPALPAAKASAGAPAGSSQPATPAERPVQATVAEDIHSKRVDAHVQRQVATQPQAVMSHDVNKDAVFEARLADVSLLSRGPAPEHASRFKFARSAAIEAAVGSSSQVAQGSERSASPAGLVKIAAEEIISDSGETTHGGAGNGSSGQEGLLSEHSATPGVPGHPSTNHPVFSVETTASSSVSTASDSSRLAHEGVVNQVRDHLSSHEIKQGGEQIVLKLNPEHLGEIKVHLTMDAQRLNVEIVADNRMAREVLLQHVDTLKESLSRQNISMEKFDVTSGNSGSGSQGSPQGQGFQADWREMARNRQAQQWLSGGYRMPVEQTAAQPQIFFASAEHSTLDVHF